MNSPTAHLRRSILRRAALALGYMVSGNHVFPLPVWHHVEGGRWTSSVIERPDSHGARIVRIARLLAATY